MRPFHVTILGCSSATPTVDRHPSAQLFNVNEKLLLIDCGEGTQNQLLKYHFRFQRIQHIYISHLHGDHFLGLPGLLSTMSLNGRNDAVHIYAPADLEKFLDYFLRISGTTLLFPIIFHPISQEAPTILSDEKDFQVMAFPLTHRVDCTGFIITEKFQGKKINKQKCEEIGIPLHVYGDLKNGKDILWNNVKYPNDSLTWEYPPARKYIYASDTAYMPELSSLFDGADLLYHESTFLHDMLNRAQETYHTTALQAGMMARDSQVKKLLLGHFSARYRDLSPLLDEARSVFSNTHLALEGETYYCS